MLIITEKPMRTVDVCGWYIDDYVDKSGKKIYKIVGVISPKQRGRLVSRDSEVIKDVYMDEETITIYRSENYNNVSSCKRVMDLSASRGLPVFSLLSFGEWLRGQSKPEKEEVTIDAD